MNFIVTESNPLNSLSFHCSLGESTLHLLCSVNPPLLHTLIGSCTLSILPGAPEGHSARPSWSQEEGRLAHPHLSQHRAPTSLPTRCVQGNSSLLLVLDLESPLPAAAGGPVSAPGSYSWKEPEEQRPRVSPLLDEEEVGGDFPVCMF